MNDYLEIGGLIIARLQEQLPDVRVSATWSMTEIKETPDLAPSLMVLLEGDTPGEVAANGRDQKVEQRWTVVVIVRDAETEAGPMISRVIAALAGWKQAGWNTPLKRVPSANTHDWTPSKVFFFPVTFAVGFVCNV